VATAWVGALLVSGCRPAISMGSRPGFSRGPESRQVAIRVDGQEIPLVTNVLTVREALAEASVLLDDDDRVEPDLWVDLQDGMTVRVIRVQQETIVEREMLAYLEQTIKSEGVPVGETRLLQAGKNGQAEITYRLEFEDGVEVSRSVLRRVVVEEPVNQITVVGVEGMVDSVELPGTVAYLNGGNAWVMRGASGGRRPVTAEGDLDGRVFALSPDGATLLYSVITETEALDGPFNELVLLNVELVDEPPRRLPIRDVLWAGWAPCERSIPEPATPEPPTSAESTSEEPAPEPASPEAQAEAGRPCGLIAYSTGEKSGPPGWRANNDLWTATLLDDEGRAVAPKPRRLLGPQTGGAYSWWGSHYAWSPDRTKIAYARPDQVGWMEVRTSRVFPLATYPPQAPRGSDSSDQVWVPAPSWSPDSRFVALTIHGEEPGRSAEESRLFEVWVLDLENTIRARLTRSVGMWSTPRWSPERDDGSAIAYAEAHTPSNSYESRYVLKVMDRDGSNKRVLFPAEGQAGIARPVIYDWSPSGRQLVVLYLGNLYLVDPSEGQARQLTGDGQSTHLDWAQ
jgi:hypothetical protein